MAPIVEKVLDGLKLGEGPHWDDKNQCLYFVDMLKSTIHKYIPAIKKHTQAKIGDHNVSIIIPVKEKQNEFVVTLGRSVALIQWDGESKEVNCIKKLYEVEEGTTHVFNDGKFDKTGRLWTGTISTRVNLVSDLIDKQGTLYSFFKDTVKSHRSEVGISNGIAFDYTLGKMYYNDSFRHRVDQYDIDLEKGTLSNLKTIFTIEQHGLGEDGLCDGMTIDTNGNLWVAMFEASAVYNIDPRTGTVLQTIKLPAAQITSVAFGGPNLDELYVTSANLADVPPGENPGSLFHVTGLNIKGFPADEAVV